MIKTLRNSLNRFVLNPLGGEDKNMRSKIISIIQIVFLIIFILLLSTILKPCVSEMTMKCNYSVSAVKLLLATVVLIKGMEVFTEERIHIYLDVASILLLLDSILIPSWFIGGCKMSDMACQARTFPSVYIVAGAIIVINLILVARRVVKLKDEAIA